MANVVLSPDSRYQFTQFFIDNAGNSFWGLWKRIEFPARSDDQYFVIRADNYQLRIDLLAKKFYNNYNLWWIICEANSLVNPFVNLGNPEAVAQSPIIYSADDRPCFYLTAKVPGARFNSGQSNGITFKYLSDPTEKLMIYVNGVLRETFDNLSEYPMIGVDGQDTTNPDPDFWGNVASSYVNVVWVSEYTNRPSEGQLAAPIPNGGSAGLTSFMFGGNDFNPITLRIPSQSHVQEALSS